MKRHRQAEQLHAVLSECLGDRTDVPISAASLALCAMKRIDPDDISLPLVAFGCNMELRQMAREMLRETYDPTAKDWSDTQGELFQGLQKMYPCKRQGKDVYVPRMQMTLAERERVLEMMTTHIKSRIKHRDALQSETDALKDQGFFSAARS